MSGEFIRQLEKRKKQMQAGRHLGISVSAVSILYGMFITYHNGHFMRLLYPFVIRDLENLIGMALIIVGVFKLCGVLTNVGWMKRIGIVALLFSWGGLFAVSVVYSIGVGYPSAMPIFFGKIVWDCLQVTLRGDFEI